MTNEEEEKVPDRNELMKISVTEKKTLQLLEHTEFFEKKMKEYKEKLVDQEIVEKNSDLKTIEGRDI